MKRKDDTYNCHKMVVVSPGMTGSHVEVSLLMDFMVRHYTKVGVEGDEFKMPDNIYNRS